MDYSLQKRLEPIYKKYGLKIMDGNAMVTGTFAALTAFLFERDFEKPEDLPIITLQEFGRFKPFQPKDNRWAKIKEARHVTIHRIFKKENGGDNYKSRPQREREAAIRKTEEFIKQNNIDLGQVFPDD